MYEAEWVPVREDRIEAKCANNKFAIEDRGPTAHDHRFVVFMNDTLHSDYEALPAGIPAITARAA
jgi:hypothetical protein